MVDNIVSCCCGRNGDVKKAGRGALDRCNAGLPIYRAPPNKNMRFLGRVKFGVGIIWTTCLVCTLIVHMTKLNQGRSLELFFINGNPDGMLTAEVSDVSAYGTT
jgi:hypothetical protein